VTTVNGVAFGVETFSFHDLPPAGDPQLIPTIVKNLQTLGIAECEIMSGHVEPFASVMTGWWVQSRRSPDFARLREGRRRVRAPRPLTGTSGGDCGRGLRIYPTTSTSTRPSRTPSVIGRSTRRVSSVPKGSARPRCSRRGGSCRSRRSTEFVAMHNHNNLADPDQFATPAS
jgi:hypothetical protein